MAGGPQACFPELKPWTWWVGEGGRCQPRNTRRGDPCLPVPARDPSDQDEEADAEPGAESEWGADDLEWEQTDDGEHGEEGWGEETGGHTEQPVRPPAATLSAGHQVWCVFRKLHEFLFYRFP